jgi:hypothetical protein
MQPREKTIIEKALDVFRKRTRIDAHFLYEKTGKDLCGDGIVRLAHEGQKWELKAGVTLWVNRATIALLKQKMDRAGEGLLVTDYVNLQLAKVIKKSEHFFIDAAGNAFIDSHVSRVGQTPGSICLVKP